MCKQLHPKGFPESSAQATYCMPKAEQLSVVFAAVCLGKRFSIIGITEADTAQRYSELIELAVIAPKTIWPSSARRKDRRTLGPKFDDAHSTSALAS